jgi:aflatoxin B1 aldehyde reductase
MPGVNATPEIIFGCASFGDPKHPQAKFNSPENTLPLLEFLRSRGVTYLDTARAYPVGAPGTSEALLGTLGVGEWATVDTKVVSWKPGTHSAEGIANSIPASLEALKMPKVNVMYLHAPDRSTPFEITLRAMDKAYKEGKFERFGVSNYTAEEVEEMVHICEREGLIKPTVYQGRYNAIIRSGEEGLFPTLRKHGISFYAYR